ncbi:HIRAN domain-containing protein [Methylophaga thiooxydans]|uniref:HIRAN domain-containing protein n=1 Tax=Methylophaga thiooxydans TaxID=392484 RepID=UPI002355BA87|nr:HIRAN domain-containing protein [Methylophaga thiooxydans]
MATVSPQSAFNSQREADNPYDKRAVGIYWKDAKLGYIPCRDNAVISQMLDRGEKLQVQILQLNDDWKPLQVAVSAV